MPKKSQFFVQIMYLLHDRAVPAYDKATDNAKKFNNF